MGIDLRNIAPGTSHKIILIFFLLLWTSCQTDSAPPRGSSGLGLGDSCEFHVECRFGLHCINNACAATGETPLGQSCTLTAECTPNSFCLFGSCDLAGDGVVGDLCSNPTDCERGLTCVRTGVFGTCEERGVKDLHESCEDYKECMSGLECWNQVCVEEQQRVSEWSGVECEETDDTAVHRVYFEIPRADQEIKEFYRLPFPNDIRLRDGHPDLRGHPAPSDSETDNALALFRAIEEGLDGWGLTQSIYFRFTRPIDHNTITVLETGGSLILVNIDPGSDRFNQRYGMAWFYTTGVDKYICQNWLVIHPPWTDGFQANTTYAVILTRSVHGLNGEELVASSDLELMLAPSEPDEAELVPPWQSYALLRDYLESQEISITDVAGATVFTTHDPNHKVSTLRQVVHSGDVPISENLMLCGSEENSPCGGESDNTNPGRGCPSSENLFYELQGTYPTPIFQEGEPPYAIPGSGRIVTDIEGMPIVDHYKDICFSITLPKEREMPEEGWPVVLFAHARGSEFNYRSFVDLMAGPLADLESNGEGMPFAMIGIDGPLHGPGSNGENPHISFFRLQNLEGSRSAVLQGVADLFQLTRFVHAFEVVPGDIFIEDEIRFDPDRIFFVGDFQGATIGSLFMAYEPEIKGAVLNSASAATVIGLLGQTEPVNMASGLASTFEQEGMTDFHPIINLIQAYFEPVDPLFFAPALISRPNDGISPKHLLQIYSVGDMFIADGAQKIFAMAARLPVIEPVLIEFYPDQEALILPVSGNFEVGGFVATGGVQQYEVRSGEGDGNRGLFSHPDAMVQVARFLMSMVIDEVPEITGR